MQPVPMLFRRSAPISPDIAISCLPIWNPKPAEPATLLLLQLPWVDVVGLSVLRVGHWLLGLTVTRGKRYVFLLYSADPDSKPVFRSVS